MKINSVSTQNFGKLHISGNHKRYLNSKIDETSEKFPIFNDRIEYIKNSNDTNIWVKDNGDVHFEIQNWTGIKGSIYKDKVMQDGDVWEKFKYAVYNIENIKEKEREYKRQDDFDKAMNDCNLNAIASWNYPGAYSGFYGSGWGGF